MQKKVESFVDMIGVDKMNDFLTSLFSIIYPKPDVNEIKSLESRKESDDYNRTFSNKLLSGQKCLDSLTNMILEMNNIVFIKDCYVILNKNLEEYIKNIVEAWNPEKYKAELKVWETMSSRSIKKKKNFNTELVKNRINKTREMLDLSNKHKLYNILKIHVKLLKQNIDKLNK